MVCSNLGIEGADFEGIFESHGVAELDQVRAEGGSWQGLRNGPEMMEFNAKMRERDLVIRAYYGFGIVLGRRRGRVQNFER